MELFPFSTHLSKVILRSILTEEKSYERWMKRYIKPKEFYFLRSFFAKVSDTQKSFSYIQAVISSKGIVLSLQEFESLMRYHNKLCFYLLFYRSGLGFGKSIPNDYWVSLLIQSVFITRLTTSGSFSTASLERLKLGENITTINLCLPVCPDYSYEMTAANTYRYTFKSIGDGIGLVASKALQNAKILQSHFQNSPLILSRLNLIVLVGDFEAKPHNLRSFALSYDQFMERITGSINAIQNDSGYNTIPFTSLCGGYHNWIAAEQITRLKYNLNSYECLDKNFPHIRHEKNLMSRIPLYSKWFSREDRIDYKKVFFDQVVEYALMGDLVSNIYGSNSIILASDHKAMRPYYSLNKTHPTIGTNNDY